MNNTQKTPCARAVTGGLLTGSVTGIICWVGRSVVQAGALQGFLLGSIASSVTILSERFFNSVDPKISKAINTLRSTRSTNNEKELSKQEIKSQCLKFRVISIGVGLLISGQILKIAAAAGLILMPHASLVGAAGVTTVVLAIESYTTYKNLDKIIEKLAINPKH